jgi:sporulation protein YlmC with PRC-barrel domain
MRRRHEPSSEQDGKKEKVRMKRSTLVSSVAICLCFGLSARLSAAQLPATATPGDTTPAATVPGDTTPAAKDVTAVQPAQACLADVRSFSGKMRKDGYWLGGSDYAYGYPMDGYGYGYGYPKGAYPASAGYSNARPGYEVRTLIASANILAQQGQQQPCEDILATTRTIYERYATEMHGRGIAKDNGSNWHRQQIAAALPVTDQKAAFRSDQLLDSDVLSLNDESLGSVHDIVMSPQTGTIAYLVIARGGLFGIDQKYVPVPWADFKATPNANTLVLNTTKAALQAAPQVGDDKFATKGQFAQESEQVDAYWKTQLPAKAIN